MKNRLVEEAFKPGSSFGIVAKRTKLKRERVLSFRKMLLKGKALFPGKGRPTKLDHISISNLVDVIRSEPAISNAVIYKHIREEVKKTYQRRNNTTLVVASEVHIARASVIRRTKRLVSEVNLVMVSEGKTRL